MQVIARLVPENMEGRALTIIMAGTTLGSSVGLPVMTTVGLTFGWRTGFSVPAAFVALLAVLSYFVLPTVDGEKLSRSNSPFAVLRIPSMLVILLLTFLSVVAHYGIYTYITLLVELIDLTGGIGMALLIFGIGSGLSVVVTARFINVHLRALIVFTLAIGGTAMALLLVFDGVVGLSHFAFFLWGVAFGPVVTMYQTAVTKQVSDGVTVATSVQSSVFNFSMMIATWIGGTLLTYFPDTGVTAIVYVTLAAFAAALRAGDSTSCSAKKLMSITRPNRTHGSVFATSTARASERRLTKHSERIYSQQKGCLARNRTLRS